MLQKWDVFPNFLLRGSLVFTGCSGSVCATPANGSSKIWKRRQQKCHSNYVFSWERIRWAILPFERWHSEKVRTVGVLLHPSATAEQAEPSSQQCNLAQHQLHWDILVMNGFSSDETTTPLSSYCHPLVSPYTSCTSCVHVSTGTLWCGASPWALAPWTCALAPLQMPKQRFIVSMKFWTSRFKLLVLWSSINGFYRWTFYKESWSIIRPFLHLGCCYFCRLINF